MRYLLILLSFLYINCARNNVRSTNSIESMIDIYVNGFGFNENDNFYLRVIKDEKDLLILNLKNIKQDYDELVLLENYYISDYKGIKIILKEKDLIFIEENVPTNLTFRLSKNEMYNRDYNFKPTDYPELDFFFNKNDKNIEDIYYDGIGVKIIKLIEYPYFKLEKKGISKP